MSTPNRDKDLVFLQMAATLGTLGTCDRAHVGAIIVKEGRAISWGYNGAPAGMPHCSENNHGWDVIAAPRGATGGAGKKQWAAAKAKERGCRNVTHAEANAICFAARQGISTADCTIFIERSPCLHCSHLIIASGISTVVVKELYRDLAGWELLHEALIERRIIAPQE